MKNKNNLGLVRKIVGLKGVEVAKITDIPVQNVRTWENGARRPLIHNILVLADLYTKQIHTNIQNRIIQKELDEKEVVPLLNSKFTIDYLLHRQLTDIDVNLLRYAYNNRSSFNYNDSYFSTTLLIRESLEYRSDCIEFDITDPTNPHISLQNTFLKGAPEYRTDDLLTEKFWK
ncbi:helix-turn-helix domain-containing protein [Pediococcus pentosaceus]|uniref:helix-turn-helix domain-containing protein n=1 Tax=Pediococcus pentosaceus TaxID=1255 RepID=UPI0021A3DB53|nr:helix-turn-helix transcriptional regulator [Pediococcus pentosaceus]MCT3033261.1 XRE family transcriptional regulator [Pediococcus pentosaceus]